MDKVTKKLAAMSAIGICPNESAQDVQLRPLLFLDLREDMVRISRCIQVIYNA